MTVIMTTTCALAQAGLIHGTVVSASDNEPLPGATVLAPDGQGVATDLDGKFSIKVAPGTNLKVSYVGYADQTVPAAEGMVVKLQEGENRIDEVLVVAYGTAKKSAYTGSASQVNAKEIENRMVANPINALKGEVSGVQILSSNGQPGSVPTVLVRGVGSINASTSPLYVVDGVPVEAADIPQLNTMDIQSMTVLKDAASAALYGARGANGVILITTKRGQEGTAKVTLDARWGSNSRMIPNYDVIKSPAQYYEMTYSALYNGNLMTGQTPQQAHAGANATLSATSSTDTAFGAGYNIWTVPFGQAIIGTNGKLNPAATLGYSNGQNYFTPDDWADATFQNGLRQEYSVSVSGGNDRFTYYASGSYLSDDGIVKGSEYDRLSTRLSMEYQAKPWLKLSTNTSYNYVKSGSPDAQTGSDWNSGSNAFMMANTVAPIYPMFIRNADGSILMDKATGYPVYDYGDGVYSVGIRNFYNKSNAESELIYNTNDYLMDILNTKWSAIITPVKDLTVTGTVGYYLDNTRNHNLLNNLYGQMKEYGGYAEQGYSRKRSINLQALATYKHTIAELHNLDYLLGYESYDYNSETISARGYNLYQPGVWAVNNTLNNDRRKGFGSVSEYATRGIFARVNYDYNGRYFASVSYRRDASSRFAPDKRWGNFFSLSAAWDMSKESFMQDFTNVDLLKAKVSFGQQGNDGIGNNYAYLDQFTLSGSDSWSDGNLYYKGNPELTWETSNAFNAGFDVSFFQGRINGTLEYFQRQTSDMLYNKPVSPSNGYEFIPMNVGSMRNNGMELEVRVRPVQTRDITWEIMLNTTWQKNKVLKLHPDLDGQMISGVRIYKEGESMYNYFMVEYAGVDAETGNPSFWATRDVLDANGDKIPVAWDENNNPIAYQTERYITTNYDTANTKTSKILTGNTLPNFYGGFGTSVQAFGFDLSVNFSYSLGGRVLDYGYLDMMHSGGKSSLGKNWHVDALKAWTPENTNTNIPKLNTNATYNLSDNMSTFALVSSNYLALNNVTLGYNLPKKLIKKIGFEAIRVYAAGDNLALWSKRKGLDPRYGLAGVRSNQTYSAIRNISGGIRVEF